MIDPESGYTPANLRAAIMFRGWRQKDAAKHLGVSERTLRQWLHPDINSKSHRDMPLRKWLELFNPSSQP